MAVQAFGRHAEGPHGASPAWLGRSRGGPDPAVVLNGALGVERQALEVEGQIDASSASHAKVSGGVAALQLGVGRLDAAPDAIFIFERR